MKVSVNISQTYNFYILTIIEPLWVCSQARSCGGWIRGEGDGDGAVAAPLLRHGADCGPSCQLDRFGGVLRQSGILPQRSGGGRKHLQGQLETLSGVCLC